MSVARLLMTEGNDDYPQPVGDFYKPLHLAAVPEWLRNASQEMVSIENSSS